MEIDTFILFKLNKAWRFADFLSFKTTAANKEKMSGLL